MLAAGPACAQDDGIAAFEAAQQVAWNGHDAVAYSAAFAPDADIIAATGWHWAGQDEARRNIADGFRLVYAHARLSVADVRVRMAAPGLAAVTLSWSISGARTIDGGSRAGEMHGFETQLLTRGADGWHVLAQQDTETTAAAPALAPVAGAAVPAAAPAAFPTTPPPVRRCIVARGNGDCLVWGKPRPAQ